MEMIHIYILKLLKHIFKEELLKEVEIFILIQNGDMEF